MKLNKETIDDIPAGTKAGTWYLDDELRGFFLVSWESGRKAFFVRYTGPGGRRRAVKIGYYGSLTPDAARKQAKALLATATLGGDPAGARDAKRETPTWAKWVETYLSRVDLQKKYGEVDHRFLGRTEETIYARIYRRWAPKKLDEIDREDVEIARVEIARTGHTTAANRWLASVRACLSAALKSNLIPAHPALRIKHYQENPPRARVLTPDEMVSLIDALDEEPDRTGAAALRFVIETGCRRSEILHAKWGDFDLKAAPPTWRIPSPKTGRPQVIPIPTSSVKLLEALPHLGAYVIAGRSVDKPRPNLAALWYRVLDRAKLRDAGVHIHDLRRTFGLFVARDAGLHVASKLLRHSNVLVTEQVYAPLGLKELGEAMERRSQVLPFARSKKA